MSKEGTVSIPRGVPPKALEQHKRKLEQAKSGGKLKEPSENIEAGEIAEPPKPMEEDRGSYTPVPPQVDSPKPLKKSVPTERASLTSSLLDLEFEYIEAHENLFSVTFVLAKGEKIKARPKQMINFVVECPAVTRQELTWVGPPTFFETLDVSLFTLLKVDGTSNE
jgi:hypothetical protein